VAARSELSHVGWLRYRRICTVPDQGGIRHGRQLRVEDLQPHDAILFCNLTRQLRFVPAGRVRAAHFGNCLTRLSLRASGNLMIPARETWISEVSCL